MYNRASVNHALSATEPVLNLSQPIVIGNTASIHPLNKRLPLSDVGIDSISVVHSQHSTTLTGLLTQTRLVKYLQAIKIARVVFHPWSKDTRFSHSRLFLIK